MNDSYALMILNELKAISASLALIARTQVALAQKQGAL